MTPAERTNTARQPLRIVILGNAGSGKSTLARRLGKRLALPVIHMDRLFWGPGWTKPDAEAFRTKVREATAAPGWVCEGNYHRRTFDLRLPRADLIIWLNTPRAVCLQRVALRSLRNADRPALPAGCTEKINAEFLAFLRYVWRFDRDERPSIEKARGRFGAQVPLVTLRGRRQIDAFLRQITA